jgi:autotransporter-associated beta strand protein
MPNGYLDGTSPRRTSRHRARSKGDRGRLRLGRSLEALEPRITPAVDVWTGASSALWSDNGNWQDGSAPTAGSDLVFPEGASHLTNINDFAADTSFGDITIGGGGYAITGNRIDLAGNLLAAYTAGTSSLDNDLRLSTDPTITVASDATLDLAGALVFDSAFSGRSVVKSGGGLLRYSGTTANTYNGSTTVNAGTLVLAKSPGVTSANGSVIIGDGATAATVRLESDNQFWAGSTVILQEGSTFDVGTQQEFISVLTLQGATVAIDSGGVLKLFSQLRSNASTHGQMSDVNGPGALELVNAGVNFDVSDDASLPVDLRIGAVLQGSSPAGGFFTSNGGTLALSGASTFEGDVSVGAGTIRVESDTALGATAGTTSVADGAAVEFTGVGRTVAETFADVAGTGVGGRGVLRVVAGDTALTGPVTMTADVGVGAADGSTLAIMGVIDDGGSAHGLSVTNGATGRTILGVGNLFDGDVTARAGFLRATADNALGDPTAATNVVVEGGATLELGGGITIPTTKPLTIWGVPVASSSKVASVSGDNAISGDVAIAGGNNESFDVPAGRTLTVAGAISGSRDFDKNGAGTLVLSGTSTHTGNVNVGEGTLVVDGSLATSSLVFVDGTLAGSGTVPAVTASGIGTIAPGNSPGVLTSGNVDFTDGSSFAVQLDGAAVGTQYDQLDVTGSVVIGQSTLNVALGHTPAIGDQFVLIANDGSDAVTGAFNGLAQDATFTLGPATFRIRYNGGDGNDVTLTVTDVTFTWSGAGVAFPGWSDAANWVGNLVPTAGSNLVFPASAARRESVNDLAPGVAYRSIAIASGGFDIYGNAIRLAAGITTTFAAGGSSYSLATELLANTTITVGAGGSLAMGDVISGAFNLAKAGAGTLELSAANTYTGTTAIDAGRLRVTGADALGGTAAGTRVNHAATLQIDGVARLAAEPISFGGNSTLYSSGIDTEIPGPVSLTGGNTTLAASGGTTLTFSGVIGGTNAPDLFFGQADRTGSVVLSGNNTFNNYIDVYYGTLVAAHANALGGTANGVFTVGSGATLAVRGGVTIAEPIINLGGNGSGGLGALRSLGGDNTWTGPIGLSGHAAFGVDGGSSLTIGGVISDGAGARNLTKLGAGTLVLAAANTYAGTTAVQAGTLAITNASAPGSQVVVGPGATLGGSGQTGPVTVQSGGTFAPGASPSLITVASLTLAPGSTFVEEVDGNTPGAGGYDQTIVTTGPIDLGSATLHLVIGVGTSPAAGDVLEIIDNQTASPILGTFAGLDEGAVITAGGSSFVISYVGGDGNDVTLSVVVPTTTVVTSSLNPTAFGQAVTFTATVTPSMSSPGGTVAFFDGATLLGTSIVVDAGVATLATSTLTAGTHAITAVFTGAGAYSGSTSPAFVQVVNRAVAGVGLVSSLNPIAFGQSVTFTATVTPQFGGVVPTGTVRFLDGATPLGDATLDGAGVATFSGGILSAASHAITAQYLGDGSFSGGTWAATTQVVHQAATVTGLISQANPTTFGQPATFTATVAPAAIGSPTPSGSVAFFDGATLLGSIALSGGTASITAGFASAGSRSITAVYSGDANYLASTAPVVTQTISPTPTAASVVGMPNPATFGQPLTFVAVVSAGVPAAGVPAGTFRFFDGAIPIGSVAADASGVATLTTSSLAVGAHSVTVVFTPSGGDFAGSTSPAYSQAILAPSRVVTSVVVTSATPSSTYGQNVVFTATIRPASGPAPTAGTVTFFDSAVALATVPVVNGLASFATSTLAAGSNHVITAAYTGGAGFLAANSHAVVQAVGQAATQTVITYTLRPLPNRKFTNLLVNVTLVTPSNLPASGTVTIYANGRKFRTVSLENGTATTTVRTLPGVGQRLKAVFNGNANQSSSSSSTVVLVPRGPSPAFRRGR